MYQASSRGDWLEVAIKGQADSGDLNLQGGHVVFRYGEVVRVVKVLDEFGVHEVGRSIREGAV